MSVPSSDPFNDDDDNHSPEVLSQFRAKQKIAALECEIQNLKSQGPKKRFVALVQANHGRAIRCVAAMFDSIDVMVAEYDRRWDLEERGNDDVDGTVDENRTYCSFVELVRYVPRFSKMLTAEPVELEQYYKNLRKGADGACGDDASKLKTIIGSWMTELFQAPEPPLDPNSKADRGLQHDDTGRLLCPSEFNWDDASVRAKIRQGDPDFLITADSWPAFLYIQSWSDPSDFEKGLLCSALLLKTYKCIFTSPSSASEIRADDQDENQLPIPKKQKKLKSTTWSHVAHLMGLKTVTPCSIAYAAVQLRFALSNITAWRETDGDFDYISFYNNIIDYFKLVPGPAAQRRVNELLQWWTRKIFGPATTTQERPRESSSVSKMAAQRAAKEQDDLSN